MNLTPEQRQKIIDQQAVELRPLQPLSMMQRCLSAGVDPKDCLN